MGLGSTSGDPLLAPAASTTSVGRVDAAADVESTKNMKSHKIDIKQSCMYEHVYMCTHTFIHVIYTHRYRHTYTHIKTNTHTYNYIYHIYQYVSSENKLKRNVFKHRKCTQKNVEHKVGGNRFMRKP